jgi:formylglycine-generating enzyme required for sulfatase activity
VVDATDDTMGHKYAEHPWGLMHMHGNVWQWCEYYYDKTNVSRVLRGGSWINHARGCRAAFRLNGAPDDGYNNLGLRLVVRGLP